MNCQSSIVYKLARLGAGVMAVALVTMAAACTGPQAPSDVSAGLDCVDDSQDCIGKRAAALNALTSDSNRAWVRQPAGPKAYASGVRLIALRNKKSELTCDELGLAKRETAGAKTSLRIAGSGLTPAQISRALLLADDVGRQIAAEIKRRCRKSG